MVLLAFHLVGPSTRSRFIGSSRQSTGFWRRYRVLTTYGILADVLPLRSHVLALGCFQTTPHTADLPSCAHGLLSLDPIHCDAWLPIAGSRGRKF
jgi:hypothetical protein